MHSHNTNNSKQTYSIMVSNSSLVNILLLIISYFNVHRSIIGLANAWLHYIRFKVFKVAYC